MKKAFDQNINHNNIIKQADGEREIQNNPLMHMKGELVTQDQVDTAKSRREELELLLENTQFEFDDVSGRMATLRRELVRLKAENQRKEVKNDGVKKVKLGKKKGEFASTAVLLE